MSTTLYSSVGEVKAETGVEPDHLGFATDTELDSYITNKLKAAKDFINQHRERDFAQEFEDGEIPEIPGGINAAALEMASNSVIIARIRRASNNVNLSDYETRILTAGPITSSITSSLEAYEKGTEVEQEEEERRANSSYITSRSQFYRPGYGYPIANRDDEIEIGLGGPEF